MKNLFANHWPFVISAAALWIAVGIALLTSLRLHEGHFVYALDDAYIHMAMAKNFSQVGTWGITRHEFNSTTSSVLWTSLLSFVYFATGVHEWTPFILNIIFATFTLLLVHLLLLRRKYDPWFSAIVLLGIAFVAPFPALIFGGMEHALQTFLAVAFIFLAARVIAADPGGVKRKEVTALFIIAPLVVLVRFEGLFLVFIVWVLFLSRRRWAFSTAFGITAVIPLVMYQASAVARGWFWLPNSILIRANLVKEIARPENPHNNSILEFAGRAVHFFGKSYDNVSIEPLVLFLLIGNVFLLFLQLRERKVFWVEGPVMLTLFAGTGIFHLLLGGVGQFYRYEAYLIAVGLLLMCIYIGEAIPERVRTARTLRRGTILVLILLAFVERGLPSLRQIPTATTNIYEQQYQTARFLCRYYENASVAANDVGAINYYADIDCFDLMGLANLDVARKRLAGEYDSRQLYILAQMKGVKIAVAYDHWFQRANFGGLPSEWSKVGEWEIENNIVCAGEIVSIYAVDPSSRKKLISSLKQFAADLPPTVCQRMFFTE